MDDWNERSNKRRDERHTKVEKEVSSKNKKKDTKKWCGGKVGREHILNVRECDKFYGVKKYSLYCVTCGKELDYWFPATANVIFHKKEQPKWVEEFLNDE